MLRTLYIAGLLLAALSTAASAEIYKWTDEDGNVHFSEKKPADAEAETVQIRYTEPSAEAQEKLQETIEQDQKAAEERLKAEEDQALEERNLAVQQRNCEKARAHLAELQRVVRLFHTDDEGNRVRVGEEERQADIEKMEQVIAEKCSG
jgi:hypothetical protein